ncbi:unnamed protein product [Clavelina lepadiformis]|uniref:Disease resistance R13L4/SHOC-2-like LRR domain-containing protein n=1 Tax=Clavelina lepadiformis TaxID=159417 RepID=A0ABP0GIV8_CLALP
MSSRPYLHSNGLVPASTHKERNPKPFKTYYQNENQSRIPVPSRNTRNVEAGDTNFKKTVQTEKVKVPVDEDYLYFIGERNSRINTLKKQSPQLNPPVELKGKDKRLTNEKVFMENPAEILRIKYRKNVKITGLELATLSPELFDRRYVESLILSPERKSCLDFKLPYLPSAIGNLVNLRQLILDTNDLHALPDEIEKLRSLEVLILSNNCLSTLPQGITNLKNLKSLHLANNRFLIFPLEICFLTNLGFLDLSDNDVRVIPGEISQLSTTLQTLLLFMNAIEKLPESFSTLTLLSCLWLGENDLTILPEDFGELFRLDWGQHPCSSNIDGNPLVRPPLVICRQGPYEIRKYFHNLKENNKRKSEAKSKNIVILDKENFLL